LAHLSSLLAIPTLRSLAIALLIFLIFLFLRRTIASRIIKLLLKIAQKTPTSLDDHLVKAFEVPLQLFFAFLGFYLALTVLPLTREQDQLVLKLFRSVIIALITMGFYKLAGNELFCGSMRDKLNIHLDKILIPFLSKTCRVIIVMLGIAVIASEWDYDINGFIAGLGIGGLAIALAAQSTLANLFGGLVIIMDKPFSIGDWIQTPTLEGTVEDINFRSTRIRSFSDALVTVPNSTLANEAITNWSRMGKRKVNFNLPIVFSAPKESLRRCLTEIRTMLQNHPGVAQDTVVVNFDLFAENGYNLLVSFFTKTTKWNEYLAVREDVNFKILDILDQTGVSLALPSQSVYFESQGESGSKMTEQES